MQVKNDKEIFELKQDHENSLMATKEQSEEITAKKDTEIQQLKVKVEEKVK